MKASKGAMRTGARLHMIATNQKTIATIIDAEMLTEETRAVVEQLMHHISTLLYQQVMAEYGNHADTGAILADKIKADSYIELGRALLAKLDA